MTTFIAFSYFLEFDRLSITVSQTLKLLQELNFLCDYPGYNLRECFLMLLYLLPLNHFGLFLIIFHSLFHRNLKFKQASEDFSQSQ